MQVVDELTRVCRFQYGYWWTSVIEQLSTFFSEGAAEKDLFSDAFLRQTSATGGCNKEKKILDLKNLIFAKLILVFYGLYIVWKHPGPTIVQNGVSKI